MFFIAKYWKPVTLAILLGIMCFASYKQGAKTCEDSDEKTKVEEKVKTEEKTTKKTKIVENKDGSKVTTIEEESKSTTKQNTKTQTEKVVEKKGKFRVGGSIQKPISDLRNSPPSFNFHGGVRVYKDLWLDGHYNFNKKELGVGFSVEF